ALLGAGLSVGAAAVWGTFRVDGDPKRAPVPVRGAVRLLIEAAVFGTATGLLIAAESGPLGLALGAAVIAHYAIGYRRIHWLWKHPGRL
ncbi:MAG: DUF2568 domain-containing protein, partial [Chloroflexi bacterium]|nr:DUF2568 domain-containing protein [Chloroflexota bacterium]